MRENDKTDIIDALNRIVNQYCTCGGSGPGESTCAACQVYHDFRAWLHHNAVELVDLRARVAELEAEIAKERAWRHPKRELPAQEGLYWMRGAGEKCQWGLCEISRVGGRLYISDTIWHSEKLCLTLHGRIEFSGPIPMPYEGIDMKEDICGLCGKPGADKIAHPILWPGERKSDTRFVHRSCEEAECARAHALLSDEQRNNFLGTI